MFVREQLENGQVPPPGLPWSQEQRHRLLEIGMELCEEAETQGLTGTPVFWHHDRHRIMTDLERFLSEDFNQRRLHRVTATASELAFGMPDGELDAVAVPLPSGRTVRFRGRADRVDQGAGDALLVTDYKTGKSDPYKDLDEDSRNFDPVLRGTRLQLPVYGLAAQAHIDNPAAPVTAQYWFVTSDQQFKAYGYRLNRRVMDRFRTVVDTITDGIEAGVFCDRPQPDRTEGAVQPILRLLQRRPARHPGAPPGLGADVQPRRAGRLLAPGRGAPWNRLRGGVDHGAHQERPSRPRSHQVRAQLDPCSWRPGPDRSRTTALVGRVISLLDAGVAMENSAAIHLHPRRPPPS